MSRELAELPEPAELYSVFNQHHPLNWGQPIPARADLLAEFGALATARALDRLATIGRRDADATREMLALLRPGIELHQLESRIKSPQSLTRKIKKFTGKRQRELVIEDVQRYTIVASVHDHLVDAARRSADELDDRGWQLTAVRNSYVDGSRYKGIHLNTIDPRGQRVELQLQSTAALAVKAATTRPYEIERNDALPRAVREAARAECIRLSDSLPTPLGLDDLTELAGCPVNVRGYGLGRDTRQPSQNGRGSGVSARRTFDQPQAARKGREL